MKRDIPNDAVGCYGDGALGHQHTRRCCADVLEHYAEQNFRIRNVPCPTRGPTSVDDLCMALRGEISSNAWEEYDACDWLDEHAPFDGHYWGWHDGDFGLWPNEEE